MLDQLSRNTVKSKWETTVDKKKVSHKLIRRVSMDQFYKIVTGEEDAFYKMCMVLPKTIEKVVNTMDNVKVPEDTVMMELREWAQHLDNVTDDLSIAMAVYMLGFSGYSGFY